MRHLLLIVYFLSSLFLFSQNQRFKSFSIKEGLSQSTVNCIIQDQMGLIWIGTQDGLNKYDGHEFTHYKKQYNDSNSIPDNNIQSLTEDSKGNIWIGTYGGGIAIYNPKSNSFKRLNSSNSLLSDDIIMCFKEFQNSMYIGTKRGGLNTFNYENEKITPIELDNNTQIQVRDIETFNNTVYAATSLGGIHYFQKSVWVKLLDTIQIQTIHSINNQLLLGGVHGELFMSSSNYFKFNKLKIEGLKNDGIWGICSDNSNSLWLGTFGGGLLKINATNFSLTHTYKNNIEDINSISHDVILSILKDKDGGIWIGTLGGGINYFEPSNQNFTHYNDISGLSNNVVMSFLENKEELYIGTYGGGLNLFNKKTNSFKTLDNVSAKIIRCIYKDNDGILWLGTYGNGLIEYNPKTGIAKQILNQVADDVWCITEINNNLWFGTWGSGLIKYDKKTANYTQYLSNDEFNSISENTVLTLAKTSDNNLWIGTYGSGLNYFNISNDEFTSFGYNGATSKETNNKKIRSIYVDENSNLWIGTDGGGLNHYNNEKQTFSYITTEQNLPNNVVYGVVEDKNKNIWVTTNYGLCRYSKKNKSISNFDYDDGLQNNEFNQGALYFKDELIYAGGINGFNVFNPKEVESSTKNTFTLLTSMKVMGKEFNPPIRFLDSINLNYSSNFLSFQFSYIDYSGKIQYRCKLEGFDKDWNYLENRNFMNYTNLPPGNYSLKFQGKRMGNWNNKYSILKINIPPPFWKTYWFYLLIIVLVLAGFYTFYVLKQKNLLKRNTELENIVKERTREIHQQNISLEEQKKEVELQKEITELKHYEIQSSINYARRIQSAILPSAKIISQFLPESFVLYKPKDIVAGDFYWMEKKNDKILIAAADCTGHGVPGAMVSVVCNNALNRSVREHGLTNPAEILNKSREIVIAEFEKSEEEVKDGMDIALCSITKNEKNYILEYAGANNPLWIIRGNELIETKANKQPIGSFRSSQDFTSHTFTLKPNDTIYIFSDGYVDQFGGEKGKKFKAKAFKELLLKIVSKTMEEQKLILEKSFETWKGDLEQIDDVCVIGFRL
ncbi:SpoIIE family protein phosphatase [Vicingus serpentipes]|uniref:SpoIIE family protein phosphatase n=1 Tax=Vicingus serpentipes TaxID=1926625 RepID=A0A5C6RXB3_9FLAO|nr:SpoIIE family protein phosphatase [Vicingus serpentipes]